MHYWIIVIRPESAVLVGLCLYSRGEALSQEQIKWEPVTLRTSYHRSGFSSSAGLWERLGSFSPSPSLFLARILAPQAKRTCTFRSCSGLWEPFNVMAAMRGSGICQRGSTFTGAPDNMGCHWPQIKMRSTSYSYALWAFTLQWP